MNSPSSIAATLRPEARQKIAIEALSIADAGTGLRAGHKAVFGEQKPCHGDVFHLQHQCQGVVNSLERQTQGATTRRQALE